MGKLLVEDKEIVVPGQVVAEGMDFLPSKGVIREEDKLVASRIGLISLSGRFVKLIPLTGKYIPKENDFVIGKVVGWGFSGWRVDIGWAFEANISLKEGTSEFVQKTEDLTRYYKYGDYIMTQIINVTGSKIIDLTMKGPGLRKLAPGRLINVVPPRVPRIIGKQGSMISMIKEHTGCRISVGQNGVVWLSGESPEKEMIAVKAIRIIESESHIPGLTDRVKEFLEKGK